MFTAFLAVTALAVIPGAATVSDRCCMTDPHAWYFDPPSKIGARFRAYRDMGVGMLRVELDWRSLEISPGVWNAEPLMPYLRLVRQYGFRVKLIVGALMGPPKWFFDAHPDARIKDEEGRFSANTVSYWYPGLRELIADKVRGIRRVVARSGLADRVDFAIPALGPAGEAIYPVPWTLGAHVTRQTMWCYDDHARVDFRRKMRARYHNVAAANAAWGTSFGAWGEVELPLPGARPGPMWHDVLTWYRDTKRDFVRWQVDMLKREFPSARTLIYVPGTAYTPEDWSDAVRSGRGNDRILMMADSYFLMDLASRTGSWLQYTGCENENEVRRLTSYLRVRGRSAPPMIGENAGVPEAARDPGRLADIVLRHGLAGLDYTHSHYAFGPDGVSETAVTSALREAFARISRAEPSAPAGRAMRARFRLLSQGPAKMEGVPEGVERVDFAGSADHTPDWALIYPPPGSGSTWVVNLHGHGSGGDQLYVRPDIRRLWLPAFRDRGLGIITPHMRGSTWMSPETASDLHELLAWVRRTRGARHFVLVGGSMGGSAALAYAVLHPSDIEAVIALCPAADIGAYARWCATAEQQICRDIGLTIRAAYAGEPDDIPTVYDARSAVVNAARLTMPVYVCHGARDNLIPVSNVRQLAAAMVGKRLFHYEEQADGNHETPLAALPRALDWALARLNRGDRQDRPGMISSPSG